MISWIQRYFQKHFRAVFAILLGVTIVSFVFVFNASSGLGRGDGPRVTSRPFFGYNIASEKVAQRLQSDANLSYSLNQRYDQPPLRALERAAALHLADEWHIPQSSDAEFKDALRKTREFAGPNGEFDLQKYQKFRDELKAQPGGLNGAITEADIARVIADDIRIEKVTKLLAGPGYVMAADVKSQLDRADTSWTIATATADYSAFKPEIKPTEAELTKSFDEAGDRFNIPPRAVVTYVEFPAVRFLAKVEVNEAELRAYYESNKARFPKPEAPKPALPTAPNTPAVTPPSDANADFAAVRADVESALKIEKARTAAKREAASLRVDLNKGRIANGPALEEFLQKRGLTARPATPFSRNSGPAELGGDPKIGEEAFALTKERYFSNTLETPNGAAVIFLQDVQPQRKPTFQEVRERVAANYVESERYKRFSDAMRGLRSQIESRLKAGEAFDKAVAAVSASGNIKLETKSFAPFTSRTAPQDLSYEIRGALESLAAKQLSELVETRDGKGLLVYVTDKKAPELNETSPRFIEIRDQLASYTARAAASNQLSELVERELKKTEPKAE